MTLGALRRRAFFFEGHLQCPISVDQNFSVDERSFRAGYFISSRTIEQSIFGLTAFLNQYFVRWIPEHFAINIC